MIRNQIKRLLLAVLVPAVVFFVFGFMATFEPNLPSVAWPWRLGYAIAGLAMVCGTGRVILQRKGSR